MDSARVGRHPIWPAPSGTLADIMIERVVPRQRPLAQPWPSSYTQTDLPPIAAQARPTHRRNTAPLPRRRFANPPSRACRLMRARAAPRQHQHMQCRSRRRTVASACAAAVRLWCRQRPLTSDATPVWPSPDRNSIAAGVSALGDLRTVDVESGGRGCGAFPGGSRASGDARVGAELTPSPLQRGEGSQRAGDVTGAALSARASQPRRRSGSKTSAAANQCEGRAQR